jgi:hypothetical protein
MATQRAPVYELGDIVTQVVDGDKDLGMVTGIFRSFLGVMYHVTWASAGVTAHYAQELKPMELPSV